MTDRHAPPETGNTAPPDYPDATAYQADFYLEADPAKVWRALSIDEYLRRWLPDQKVIEVVRALPEKELELVVEERDPPFTRSSVCFAVSQDAVGRTVLSIRHRLSLTVAVTANDNAPAVMMRAA